MSVPELNTSGGRSPRGLLARESKAQASSAGYARGPSCEGPAAEQRLRRRRLHLHRAVERGLGRAPGQGRPAGWRASTFTQPISCPGRVLLENIRSSPKEPHIHPPVHPSTPRSCRPMCWGPVMEVLVGTRRRSIGATGQLLH
jgi:hypothetical protein